MGRLAYFMAVVLLHLHNGKQAANEVESSLNCNPQAVDIVFLLDESGSIYDYEFNEIKKFVINLTSQMLIDNSSETSRVGVIKFGTTPEPVFNLSEYSSKEDVHKAILSMQKRNGNTDIAQAMTLAMDEFFTLSGGDRPEMRNVMIVVTDGRQDWVTLDELRAAALRASSLADMDVWAIGIGHDATRESLENITLDMSRVTEVATFNELDKIVPALCKEIEHAITEQKIEATTTQFTATSAGQTKICATEGRIVMRRRPSEKSMGFATTLGHEHLLDTAAHSSPCADYFHQPIMTVGSVSYVPHLALPDGQSTPRSHSVTGEPLPSARLVSWRVHSVGDTSTSPYSHFLMQWGQFFNHGIVLTPRAVALSGGRLNCTRCDSPTTESEDCFPITIPPKDAAFAYMENDAPGCLPFTRSRNGQPSTSIREQMNQITSFIDASNVYGSNSCTARELREFSGGRLRAQESPFSGTLLPGSQKQTDCRSNSCFLAGDSRANQNIGLTSMHTIWMREHNRLADELRRENEHWDDERIYQEARHIVSAFQQHITYNEFLPIVLGSALMAEYDLSLLQDGHYSGYNSSCDATISNEFATAAFRFGHSLIQSNWHTRSADGSNSTIRLSSTFFKPASLFHSDLMDSVPRGMAEQPAADFDTVFSKDVAKDLFKNTGKSTMGQDLVSRNIQRGRDHGLQPYTSYQAAFGQAKVQSFDDLRQGMLKETVDALQSVYKSVHDIDLYTGLMSELPRNGALVGPTTGRILAEQFSRLRQCDRFWYENGDQPGSFSLTQLEQIRKMSLAKVVCNNLSSMKGLAKVQPLIFHLPNSAGNAPVSCGLLPQIDLKYWRVAKNQRNRMPCATMKYTFNKIEKYTQLYSGKIWSPNYPDSYGTNLDCYYKILATSDEKPIQFTFTHFGIESGFDYVNIFHQLGNATLQTNLTGNFADLSPRTISSTGDILVHFHTDSTWVYSGFDATFENGFAI